MKRFSRSARACRRLAPPRSSWPCRRPAGARPRARPSRPPRRSGRGWAGTGRPPAAGPRWPARRTDPRPTAPGRLGPDGLVVVTRADGLVEDGRVRRQPGHRVGVDELLDGAVVEQAAGDVVEPEALAPLVECLGGLHSSPFGRCVCGAVPASLPRPAAVTGRATTLATRSGVSRTSSATARAGRAPAGVDGEGVDIGLRVRRAHGTSLVVWVIAAIRRARTSRHRRCRHRSRAWPGRPACAARRGAGTGRLSC